MVGDSVLAQGGGVPYPPPHPRGTFGPKLFERLELVGDLWQSGWLNSGVMGG
jgi:hypothetical protein